MDDAFVLTPGPGPLVAAAVHDGHAIHPDTLAHIALSDAGRLREEDPFTGRLTDVAPTRIVGRRSRFEIDLNRPPEKALYRTPDDAWGLVVWKDGVPDHVAERSTEIYDAFYAAVADLFDAKVREHGTVVVYDLHSYNHRRDGSDGPIANPEANPGGEHRDGHARPRPLGRPRRPVHGEPPRRRGGGPDCQTSMSARTSSFKVGTSRAGPTTATVVMRA